MEVCLDSLKLDLGAFFGVCNKLESGIELNGRIHVLGTIHFSGEWLKHRVNIVASFHKLVDRNTTFQMR